MLFVNQQPVSAIIVGAGHRAFVYSKLALNAPDKLKIVGVADPDPIRRKKAMETFGFSENACFENADALAAAPKFADAIINGTMDQQHLQTAIPPARFAADDRLRQPELFEQYRRTHYLHFPQRRFGAFGGRSRRFRLRHFDVRRRVYPAAAVRHVRLAAARCGL